MVVSYWEPFPGREADFKGSSPDVTAILRRQPGVCLVETFQDGDKYVAVHAYEDEAAYHSIIDNPNGDFARSMKEHRVEDNAHWVSSVRGETIPHEGLSR